jgi:hypothetical protein
VFSSLGSLNAKSPQLAGDVSDTNSRSKLTGSKPAAKFSGKKRARPLGESPSASSPLAPSSPKAQKREPAVASVSSRLSCCFIYFFLSKLKWYFFMIDPKERKRANRFNHFSLFFLISVSVLISSALLSIPFLFYFSWHKSEVTKWQRIQQRLWIII